MPQWRWVYHQEIDSTNSEARRRVASGELDSGTVVVAESQVAGRGRRGSQWLSAPGAGLLMTVVLELASPNVPVGVVSMAVGCAVVETIRGFGADAQLKWPNDVYVNGDKICGILVEQEGEHLLIGVGLNIHRWPDVLESSMDAISVNQILEQPVSREQVLERFLPNLLMMVSRVGTENAWLAVIANEYSCLTGCFIQYFSGDAKCFGRFVEIAADGAMVVELNGQEERVYQAHEIRVVTR